MKAPRKDRSERFDIPNGMHAAVCSYVIDCGVWRRESQYGLTHNRELYLRFELPECLMPDGPHEGKPAEIGVKYWNWSMFKKSKLRKQLESWRSKAFTDEEADEFDIEKVLGMAAELNVMMNEGGYPTVDAILPCREKFEPTQKVWFDCEKPGNFKDLPEWLQGMIHLPDEESQALAKEYADQQDADHFTDQDVMAEAIQSEEDPNDSIPW